MFRRDASRSCLACVLAVSATTASLARAQGAIPTPDAVRAALVPRVNDGTVAGIITAWGDADSLRFASAGVARRGGMPIDPATIFELGDVGNMLSAALLANLVTRGEVSLDDPIERFLPLVAPLATQAGRSITLGDLAFHRSGLPDRERAGAPGTAASLELRAVGRVRLLTPPGTRYHFSQLGLALLDRAMERILGMPVSDAVHSRILHPLRLDGVTTGVGRAVLGRRATGHTAAGTPIPVSALLPHRWRGAISDVARFAAMAGDTVNGPLASTFAFMMRTRSPGPDPSLPVALGWRVLRLDGRDIYWHDAQDAPGFSAYMAIDPGRARSATVLSNTARPVDAIAGQLLLGRVPVIAPRSARAPSQPVRRLP